MQRDDPLEFVGEVGAPFGLATREGLLGSVVGVRQVVDACQKRTEELAVVDDATHRDAAEADAVIAAFAADQAGPLPLAADVPVGQRDLQRGVDSLGARIGEKDVVEVAGRELGDARGELEGLGMAELEGRREVELGRLLLDRLDDGLAIVAGVAAPQSGHGVQHLPPLGRVVVHALGTGDHARVLLERPVGRERQPEGFEVVRSGIATRQLVMRERHGFGLPSEKFEGSRLAGLATGGKLSAVAQWMQTPD